MAKRTGATGFEVAVIGMAGRFPGAQNVDEFWSNLKDGVESISFFSHEELIKGGNSSPMVEKPGYVKSKGALTEDDVQCFDASFFEYTAREAEMMDPQMRLFHETCWHALEDAGCDPGSYKGLIGLYAGAADNLHWQGMVLLAGGTETSGSLFSLNLADKDNLSTRVSYKLNLKGPSFTVFTACSTSLLAVHQACQGLWSGECDMALAGGVSVTLPVKSGYEYQEGMIHSVDGHCRAFDAGASGMIFGNGVGLVVLKRLTKAAAEGDHIYAVILGSAINNDGSSKVGYTAPSLEGQAAVIRSALRMAEVEAESITYLETHGTGTSLGDPIEVEALKRAFNTEKRHFCRIGSVKTNVGHLDTAAGIAGLIKAILALKHRLIPASLHFNTANPKIDFDNSPFMVNTQLWPWKSDGSPRRAGVSAFGIGGTNAHVVLEEAPQGGESAGYRGARKWKLLLLSAKGETALKTAAQNLTIYLQENPDVDLADAAYTLQVGRRPLPHRCMLVCADSTEAVEALADPGSGKIHSFAGAGTEKPVVFMFPGQGAQYVNMGRGLYGIERVFKEEMDGCFEILKPLMACDMKQILFPEDEDRSPDLTQTEIAQPLLFVFEYALARLLMYWGIKPRGMIGHSIGEYTAACLSGVLSLEDALALVVLRGQLMQQMAAGAMVSVNVSPETLRPLLADELSLAAVNSPVHCVVSGTPEAVADFEKRLADLGYNHRRLHTSHAFHSPNMDPILDRFKEAVGKVKLNAPKIPYIANVSGKWIYPDQAKDPGYWSAQLRETVRFSEGVGELLKERDGIFLEVGPGRVLTAMVKKHPAKNPEHLLIELIRHPQDEVADDRWLLEKIGQFWLYGGRLDWGRYYAGQRRQRLSLPVYPFERRRYWRFGDTFAFNIDEGTRSFISRTPRLQKRGNIDEWFYLPSWKRAMLPKQKQAAPVKKETWLVLMDRCGIGSQLTARLAQLGQVVDTVAIDTTFSRSAEHRFAVDPGQGSHYETLFKELRQLGRLPSRVVHLWNVTGTAGEDLGFYSLIYLAQAWLKQGGDVDLRIEVISDSMQRVTGEEALCPRKAALLGPVTVIPQEHPNISCRSVDIVLPEPGSRQEKRLLTMLLRELFAGTVERAAAYRGNFRWLPTFEPVEWSTAENGDSRLKQGGVYMIIGGLGNIGLTLAEYLAENVGAKLILTGRSPKLSSQNRRLCRLQALQDRGVDVLVIKADIADEQAMAEAFGQGEERFGKIDGVIHAAGILTAESFLSLEQIDRGHCEEQFRAKADGLYVLERLLARRTVDFCLLVSSLSSVLGGLGYAVYAAANIFMDAFVQKHNGANGPDPGNWLSLNLDHWQRGEEGESEFSMTPAEGVDVFRRALSLDGLDRLVVSTADLEIRMDQWLRLEPTPGKESPQKHGSHTLHPRPNLSTPYVAAGTKIERNIAGIWQKFFGFCQVGVHDNFFELGATSLDMVYLTRKLKEATGRDVPVVSLYRYPNIRSLALYLAGDVGQSDDVKKNVDRLDRLQQGRRKLQDKRELGRN